MIGRALSVAALTAVYALALASVSPWDLAFGAVISAALVMRASASRPGAPGLMARMAAAVPLAAVVARNAIAGAWTVVLVVTGVRRPRPVLVEVPLGERTSAGAATSALLVALTPGTLLVDVDVERGVLLVHAIDAPDAESVRQSQSDLYQRHQRRVMP